MTIIGVAITSRHIFEINYSSAKMKGDPEEYV